MGQIGKHVIRVFLLFSFILTSSNIRAENLTWGGVTNLSATGQAARYPQISLSSDGTRATAVWWRSDGSNNIIQSASATINGTTATWSGVTDLSAAGQNALAPQISLSSDGTRATAVWHRSDGSNSIIQSASATISGNTATWGGVTNLSAAGQDAWHQQISLSSDGTRATAVWRRSDGSNGITQSASATISGNTATWGGVTDLSAAGQNAYDPQISLSSDGTRATAVWYRYDGSNDIIQGASTTISGNTATWGGVTDLSAAGQNADAPQISLSSDGTRATAVWLRSNGALIITQSASATISGNTATWGGVTDLSAANRSSRTPQISLSSDGTRATTVWSSYDFTNYDIQSASATISGNTATWGEVTNVPAVGQNAFYPQISLSTDGTRATAVWYISNSSNWVIIQSASATISGNLATWGGVTALSADGHDAYNPQISLSSDGTRATTVWRRYGSSDDIIRSRSAIIVSPVCYVIKASNGKTVVFCF